MLYIKDMNLVEILILSQSETKGRFNALHHKGESQGSVCIKCASWREGSGKRATETSRSPRSSRECGVREDRQIPPHSVAPASTLSWRFALAIRGHEIHHKKREIS